MKPGLRPRKPRAQEPVKAGLVLCWAGEGLEDYTQDWLCAPAGYYQPGMEALVAVWNTQSVLIEKTRPSQPFRVV